MTITRKNPAKDIGNPIYDATVKKFKKDFLTEESIAQGAAHAVFHWSDLVITESPTKSTAKKTTSARAPRKTVTAKVKSTPKV